MAFVYCDECETGMDRPSQREVLTNQYICPNCGSNQLCIL
nr:MAG TPA: DNA-directed RNA polymerase [Caudoviricetes sp.]